MGHEVDHNLSEVVEGCGFVLGECDGGLALFGAESELFVEALLEGLDFVGEALHEAGLVAEHSDDAL